MPKQDKNMHINSLMFYSSRQSSTLFELRIIYTETSRVRLIDFKRHLRNNGFKHSTQPFIQCPCPTILHVEPQLIAYSKFMLFISKHVKRSWRAFSHSPFGAIFRRLLHLQGSPEFHLRTLWVTELGPWIGLRNMAVDAEETQWKFCYPSSNLQSSKVTHWARTQYGSGLMDPVFRGYRFKRACMRTNVYNWQPLFLYSFKLHWAMARITEVSVKDIRFPTSLELHGSDAMVSQHSEP